MDVNPRSFKSIRQMVAERRVESRGDLARHIVESFRKPIADRKKQELQKQQQPKQTQTKTPPKTAATQRQG